MRISTSRLRNFTAEDRSRFVERRRVVAADAGLAVTLSEQQHVEKIGMRLEPLPGPRAERVVAMRCGVCERLDEPAGSLRNQVGKHRIATGNGIGAINRPANVVDEGCR